MNNKKLNATLLGIMLLVAANVGHAVTVNVERQVAPPPPAETEFLFREGGD